MSRKKGVCAVYCLLHVPTGKIYIGKSVDIHHRRKDHLAMLETGTHHCEGLQRLWNESSPSDFEPIILEYCSPNDLDAIKSRWIFKYRSAVMNWQPSRASREQTASYAALAKIVVEKELLGRPIRKDEKLCFLDGNRENISSSNLVVLPRIGCDKLLFHCPDCEVDSLVKKAPSSGYCRNCRKKIREDLKREIEQRRSDMMEKGWKHLEALSARLLAGDRPHPIDFMNAACMANGGSLRGVSRHGDTEAEETGAEVGEVVRPGPNDTDQDQGRLVRLGESASCCIR